ncbi:MAG: hypoxanthine-guanine phosphoribosyltransferase [Gammaproteobacteria bacterium]|nr:hypoxanthine-guanine phosphoribosyltransferase [Gammaproteobacteria bacterium]
MNAVSMDELARVRAEADCLYTAAEVEAAVDRMALDITAKLADRNPLMLATMTGGMVMASLLLPRLEFPLELDYLHLTRYGGNTSGGGIRWIKEPPPGVAGRCVLLVDDLLDYGLTLEAAVAGCRARRAEEVLTAVLVMKEIADRPGLARTDFHALVTPDRYLFGYGMDYKHYWRNGGGIFAVKGR